MRRALAVHGLLLLVSAIWGGHFVALRYLLQELSPVGVMLVRGLLASAFYVVFLLLSRRRLPSIERADWPRLVLVGFLGIAVMGLGMVYAQRFISAGVSSLIVTLNPIFTALLAYLLLGQALTRRQAGGVALAMTGLLVVMLLGAPGARFSVANVLGVLLMACAPLTWAFYTVLSKPLLATYPSLHVAAYTTIAGATPFLALPALRPGLPGRLGELDARGWAAVLFTTLLSFVVAYVLWYRGLRVLTPSQTAVYVYLVPVFGLLSAWLVLGERPTVYLLLGGATILAGVVLTNSGRAPRAASPPQARAPRETHPRPVE